MGNGRLPFLRWVDTALFGLLMVIVIVTGCSVKHGAADASVSEKTAVSALKFFQTVISPVDGDRCVMKPSCSQYGIEAIETHGLFVGWIMTCDRLIRCGGDELQRSAVVMSGNETLCDDSLKNNDFWWYTDKP
jgi:putative membrane protein insertion efficiency factor